MGKPKIFISHCEKNFDPTDYAIRMIDLIGCIPVIAETTPKLSRPVLSLVNDSMYSCDAAVVIATPDVNGARKKEPSQGVLVEIGKLQEHSKLKGKYVIIKEENVTLGPMIPEARYKFSLKDYSPIAEAILIELGAMGFFKNYYELPGSELQMHELMSVLTNLKELNKKGVMNTKQVKETTEKQIRLLVTKFMKE